MERHSNRVRVSKGWVQMFIFAASITDTELSQVFTVGYTPGRWRAIRRGSAAFAWIETPFIQVCETTHSVIAQLGHPVDPQTVCLFEWRIDSQRLIVSRRWSGEFTVLVGRRPTLVVTSHLRLASIVCGGLTQGIKPVAPGGALRLNLRNPRQGKWRSLGSFRAPHRMSYGGTITRVRELIYSSVRQLPASCGLLLSGGLDSSIIAAVARDLQMPLPAFTFSLSASVGDQLPHENDLRYARSVAKALDLPLTEILITPDQLARNVPIAILHGETWRGTMIDPAAALVEVADRISRIGLSSVVTGEAADGLFGSFTFVLRYKKGRDLQRYYRKVLDAGLPEEIAVVQRVFGARGISVVNPFWTSELKAIGYNIPIEFRVDRQRAMKRILRDAFRDLLPEEILERPKVVARNGTQVRFALEDRFGASPRRYRHIFKTIFENRECAC
jgi:asparagine synthetase B (glutamine-hydrolysing)